MNKFINIPVEIGNTHNNAILISLHESSFIIEVYDLTNNKLYYTSINNSNNNCYCKRGLKNPIELGVWRNDYI